MMHDSVFEVTRTPSIMQLPPQACPVEIPLPAAQQAADMQHHSAGGASRKAHFEVGQHSCFVNTS